jgi:hypothetical protein
MLAALALLCGAAACGPSNGGGNPATYIIEFTLTGTTEPLTVLKFDVGYDVGNFTGAGTAVECVKTATSGDSAEFEDDNVDTLTIDIVATTDKLNDDDVLATCEFVSNEQPTLDDFTITIEETAPSDEDEVSVAVTCTELEGVACD